MAQAEKPTINLKLISKGGYPELLQKNTLVLDDWGKTV
jgi:hypothetical protein